MIELKITGATPQELFDQLAALTAGTSSPVAEEATKKRKTKPAEAPKQGPTPAEPEDVPVADTEEPEDAGTWEPGGAEAVEQPTQQQDGGKAPSYTFVDIRAKGIEAAGKHGQAAVKAILTELGAKGMGELKESQFAAFVEKLEGLGESNA